MLGLTVAEARHEALPAGTALVGGEAGLDRAVTGAATMRARMPAFPTLHGGEVALVSVTLLRQIEARPRFARLLTQLADAGVAAVAFFGAPAPAELFGQDWGAVVETAQQHSLPVFVVPSPHTPEQVELDLHRALAAHRDGLLRRNQELHQTFTALALSGQGPAAILARLAAVTGLPAAWEDEAGDVRAAALPGGDVANAPTLPGRWAALGELSELAADFPSLIRSAALPLLRWRNSLAGVPGGIVSGSAAGTAQEVTVLPLRAEQTGKAASWRRMVVPFAVAGRLAGFVSVFGRAGSDTREVRLALSAASLAASIEALRMQATAEAQSGALTSMVNDWVAGRFERADELVVRARQLGQELAAPYAVLVVERGAPLRDEEVRRLARAVASGRPNASGRGDLKTSGQPSSESPLHAVESGGERQRSRGEVLARASSDLRRTVDDVEPLWTTVDSTRSMVLVPLPSGALPESAADAVHDALRAIAAQTSGPATQESSFTGIGRVAQRIEDVPVAAREATQSLAVARRLGGRHRVAYFGTLGVYRVLAAVEPAGELASFCEDVLGPLRAQDQRSGGDLLRTLEAYILSGGSPQLTAERLHTHRNTVLYRLERIQRALGVDLRQPERQLLLHLALRAAEVLGEDRLDDELADQAEALPVRPARRRRNAPAPAVVDRTLPPAVVAVPVIPGAAASAVVGYV